MNKAKPSLLKLGKATFSDSERILKGHEFRYMKKSGSSTVGKMIVLSHAKAPDGQRRLGIIVTKKFHKRAVKRNRAYRIVREAYRHIKEALPEGTWFVIIARKYLLEKSAMEVQKELIELLNREKLVEISTDSEKTAK
jgi:ribonuclease P protein component